jgi:mediator of RNA polymerase II transcription subunit 21
VLGSPRRLRVRVANKKELAGDLALKARQIDYLIQSLPPPEPEEKQVCTALTPCTPLTIPQAERLQALENQMAEANEEYVRAVRRASEYWDSLP